MPGALPRVVRLMAHAEMDVPRADVQHVYLCGAEALRRDLAQYRGRRMNDAVSTAPTSGAGGRHRPARHQRRPRAAGPRRGRHAARPVADRGGAGP